MNSTGVEEIVAEDVLVGLKRSGATGAIWWGGTAKCEKESIHRGFWLKREKNAGAWLKGKFTWNTVGSAMALLQRARRGWGEGEVYSTKAEISKRLLSPTRCFLGCSANIICTSYTRVDYTINNGSVVGTTE